MQDNQYGLDNKYDKYCDKGYRVRYHKSTERISFLRANCFWAGRPTSFLRADCFWAGQATSFVRADCFWAGRATMLQNPYMLRSDIDIETLR